MFETVQDAATEAAKWFGTRRRDDGEQYVTLRDAAPEWVRELVYAAHGEMLPDDWRYATIDAAVQYIAETDEPDAGEFADTAVDTYNADRLKWLASSLERAGYCDQAADELGLTAGSIMERIGWGQYEEACEVFNLTLSALERQCVDPFGDAA